MIHYKKYFDKIKSFFQQPINYLYILIAIFSFLILTGYFNFCTQSCFFKPVIKKTPTVDILKLLPQPDDSNNISNKKKEDVSQNNSKTEESTSKRITETQVITNATIPSLEIITLAPLNNSYIAGKNIQLAFNTSNYSYAQFSEIITHFKNGSFIKKSYTVDNHKDNYFQLTHVLPLQISNNPQKIEIKLYLIDNYNQEQTYCLTYYLK